MKKANRKHCAYSTLSLKTIFLLGIFMTNVWFATAQQAQTLAKVQTQLQKNNPKEAKQLEHLLQDIVPTAYINKAKGVHLSKSANTQAVQVIEISPESLEQIYIPNESLNAAVLLDIKFRNKADLKHSINLDKLKVLPNLKYIHLLFEIETDEKNTINQMLKGSNEQIVIIYNTSVPK